MELNDKNFKIETAHNRLWVLQQGTRFELRSHDKALQSLIDLRRPHRLMLKNLQHLMAVLLFIPRPRRVLLLGTAAGSLLHYLRHHLDPQRIDALDIDAELVEKMLELGILPPPGNGLRYIYTDAMDYLQQCDERYDLILVDIFQGAQTPAWLLQKAATESLYRMLGDDGAVAYNLLIESDHVFKRFYRDLRLVCERRTLCLPVSDFANLIAYGYRSSPTRRDLGDFMQRASDESEQLGIDLVPILGVIYNTNPVGGGVL